jgi:hypothetical protein
MLPKFQSSVLVSFEGGNCLTLKCQRCGGNSTIFVPIVLATGKPLMPCHTARARELIRDLNTVWRLNPGSKREGLTVKSKNTYI